MERKTAKTGDLHRDDTLDTLYERGRPEHLLTLNMAIRKISMNFPEELRKEKIVYAEFDAKKFLSILHHTGKNFDEVMKQVRNFPIIAQYQNWQMLSESTEAHIKTSLLQMATGVDAWAFLTASEICFKTNEIKVVEKPNHEIFMLANDYLKSGTKSLGSKDI